jgi:hypothetical protein
MKRLLVICICGALLVLAAPMAFAQNYVSLAWGECLVDGGATTISSAAAGLNCAGATGFTGRYLIFTHQLGVNQPNFVGIEGVIDMQDDTNPANMGNWWQWDIGGVGTCRTGAIAQGQTEAGSSPDFTGTSCTDLGGLATGTVTLGGLIRRPSPGTGLGPNSQRIQFQWVVPANEPIPYTANTQVAAGNIRIRSQAATGHSTCTGCTDAVTITLNSIFAGQPSGSPGGNQTATDPLPFPGQGTHTSNCVTANQAQSQCATGATPTEARTWGQLKSLYR